MTEKIINKKFGSILIIVPHQDDEILMAAGILHRAAVCGTEVHVVMATNGDYESQDHTKGETRLKESIEGLKVLGLSEECLTVLGYADTGMERAQSFLTHLYEEKETDKVYPSSCSSHTYSLLEKPEHHMAVYGTHASYTRAGFYQDLKEVIQIKKPDHIFTTSRFDIHGDHEALFYFVADILKELKSTGYMPNLYTGLVHSPAGDDIWPLRQGAVYTCPPDMSKWSDLAWEERISFPLPHDMLSQDSMKRLALSKHKEALEPNAVEFLMSFLKEEEIFWPVSYS